MNNMNNTKEPTHRESVPWFDGKKINEAVFCEEFIKDFPMVCLNNTFFTVDGMVGDESGIKQEIYNRIKPYVVTGLSKRVTSIVEVLKLECAVKSMPIDADRIHLANGTLHLTSGFTEEKVFCRNRLPVAYNPDAPMPETWLRFLSELLNDEDIPTLQEFIGYCLIPSNKGQKMLMIQGKGGEGKSRIGLVMRALLGDNMNTGSIAKIETSPFARADLENELVLLDDDLKLEALPQTNHIKAIITAELPMDLEKKGKQSYQGDLYVRFLGLGNGTLQSLYDCSLGFFRRQIILTAKEKAADRIDDPYIAEKMCKEVEGIFFWALEGLYRLMQNDFQFTISDAAKKNLEEAVSDGNNIIEFLASDGYVRFASDVYATSKDLYGVYKLWCDDNALTPLSQRSFWAYLKQNAEKYNIVPIGKICNDKGKKVRGYKGVETLQPLFLKN
ncbi:MAG: phage/plasmid primase, P4 family [Firmicutes bacterium]|nr:phage/plasmid primase, P4 family [Bacillota bacterium]